jgi:hypothetical protein
MCTLHRSPIHELHFQHRADLKVRVGQQLLIVRVLRVEEEAVERLPATRERGAHRL